MGEPATKASAPMTGAFDLFSKSKELVTKNLQVFGILYILPLLGSLSSLFGDNNSTTYNPSTSPYGGTANPLTTAQGVGFMGFGLSMLLVIIIIGIVVGGIYNTLLVAAELEAAKGKTLTLSGVWNSAKPFIFRMIGLTFVMGIVIFLGFLLFIVPGFFMIRRYFLAPFYLVDQNLSISEAMNRSAVESKPFASAIWGVIGVIVLLSLVGIIPVIGAVISLILTALYSVAPAMRYFEIKKAKAA